jgi:hypothetical protein
MKHEIFPEKMIVTIILAVPFEELNASSVSPLRMIKFTLFIFAKRS